MEIETLFVLLAIVGVCFMWGFIGLFAGGGIGGFWWGFLLGPLGVIVTAIIRAGNSRNELNNHAATALASSRLSHLARLAPVRRKIVVHKRAPTQFRRVLDCPLCGGSIDAAGVTGECECPHCCGRIAV